jgi:membrane protease YdiL (CAAX protease family)
VPVAVHTCIMFALAHMPPSHAPSPGAVVCGSGCEGKALVDLSPLVDRKKWVLMDVVLIVVLLIAIALAVWFFFRRSRARRGGIIATDPGQPTQRNDDGTAQ